MNAAVNFDTLAFVRRLEAAGMEPKQADAIVEGLSNVALAELVTKDELAVQLGRLENRLNTRNGAMLAAATALTVAILGALISLN